MNWEPVLWTLGVCVIASPALLLSILGLTALLHRPLSEASIARCIQTSVVVGLLANVAILGLMLLLGTREVRVPLGDWVALPEQHFHFKLLFVFDRLSVPFAILTFVLCGTVSAFASNYLHRESGYQRFFVLYAVFLLAMIVSSLAGTIETLFFGWELVGLSSALLVAFFHERRAPVRNGLRVWSVYRVADAAFLIAAVALHHLTGGGDFTHLMGAGQWPEGSAALTSQQALFVGSLLLIAAACKSGLIPFSGWLPRAMEGPTASSAIFYGALSVHLGAFLLLRVSPILELSTWLSATVVVWGLATAIFAAMAARVQTDIKSALAFASLTQVAIIVAEIGVGFRYLALVHIIGHACLRTLQLLRAPTLLRDYRAMENAIGTHLPHSPGLLERMTVGPTQRLCYRLAFERGYLDRLLQDYLVHPFLSVFRWCDALELRWTNLLSQSVSRESDRLSPTPAPVEEAQ